VAEVDGGREELRAGAPIRVGSVTLLPLERVVLRAARCGGAACASAVVSPFVLLVLDGGDVRVFDVGAPAPPLDELRERVAGLDAALAAAAAGAAA
jgi:hypothetical protein